MRKPFFVGLGLAVALVALAAALPSLRARLSSTGGTAAVPSSPQEAGPLPSPVASPRATETPVASPTPAPTPRGGEGRTLKAVGNPRLDAQIRKVVESMDRAGQPPKGVAQGGRRGSQRAVFQNLEGRLPAKAPGYYRESDVWPRGSGGRGPERLVFGREGEVYYTKDHYQRFVRLR